MPREVYDVHNRLVQMTMVLKLQSLNRTELPSLSYGNLEDFLTESLWKKGLPGSLHQAADEILSVSAEEIVRFLSKRAVAEGARGSLEDFSDVIGGN